MDRRVFLLGLTAPIFAAACDDDCERDEETGRRKCESPTGPTPIPEPPRVDQIEFRVIGNVNNAEIRSFNPLDGLQQTNGTLPWVYSFRSQQDNAFLSLSAKGVSRDFDNNDFIQVQIVVNGITFREASGFGIDPEAQVSGTFRRS